MRTSDRKELFDSCGGKCGYCGKAMRFREMAADPVEKLPICAECRRVKGSMTAEDFRKVLKAASAIVKRMPENGEFWYEKRKTEKDNYSEIE